MTITLADVTALLDQGWEVLPKPGMGRMVTIRRTTTHLTPDWARTGRYGWDQDTYKRHTFLTFAFADTADVVRGQIIHGDARAPWVGRSDSMVSQKRARELITEATTRHDETSPARSEGRERERAE